MLPLIFSGPFFTCTTDCVYQSLGSLSNLWANREWLTYCSYVARDVKTAAHWIARASVAGKCRDSPSALLKAAHHLMPDMYERSDSLIEESICLCPSSVTWMCFMSVAC